MPTPNCKRIAVTTTKGNYTASCMASFAAFKNVGANPIKIQFTGDGDNDYWTLGVNETSPSIEIDVGEVIYHTSVGGDSTLECLFWD